MRERRKTRIYLKVAVEVERPLYKATLSLYIIKLSLHNSQNAVQSRNIIKMNLRRKSATLSSMEVSEVKKQKMREPSSSNQTIISKLRK